MKAVIIAGGPGTRLRPLTYNTPKVIMPMANLPFILRQIELLKRHGITKLILNLHYLSDDILKILGDGEKYGVQIEYSMETEPLGTCGAVKNAEEFFDADLLIVFNGDVLTDLDLSALIKFHRKKKSSATIALTPVDNPEAFGLVLTDKNGKVERFWEKPKLALVAHLAPFYINAGTYVLDPKLFKDVPAGKHYMFEHDFFPSLLKSGVPMYGFASDSYWIDIGNPAKYLEAHRAILERKVDVQIPGKKTLGGHIGRGTRVAKGAKLAKPVLIGENCNIGSGAKISNCAVLGNHVEVGPNATLENCVVLNWAKIGAGAVIRDAIVGRHAEIADYCQITNGLIVADESVLKRGTRIA
jgi:mannose-1-phosphate guanylyltransferase